MSETFIQGTVPGSLNNASQIKLLLAFLAIEYKDQIHAEAMTDCLCAAEAANYFEISSAISDLTDSGLLRMDENGCLIPSPSCDSLVPLFEDLPYSVVEKSKQEIEMRIHSQNRESGVYVKIIKSVNGYYVKCTLTDQNTVLFENMLFATGMEEAQRIKEQMIANFNDIYGYTVSKIN